MNGFSRRIGFRQTALGGVVAAVLVCLALAGGARAGVSVTPVPSSKPLLSDNFDTNNVVGSAPVGWKIGGGDGTTVRVVDASVPEPFSPPYCVELVDNSPKGRAEMYRDFSPLPAGNASAEFKLKSTGTAHSVLQLRTANGAHLCSVIFANGGLMRYEGQGGGVKSTTTWKPGEWERLRIEWFADSTFNASLENAEFAHRVRFVTNGIPGRVYVIVGYSTVVNKIGYVDDVEVGGADAAPPAE